MSLHILPTDSIVKEIFQSTRSMTKMSFDVEDIADIIVFSLEYRDKYPDGFKEHIVPFITGIWNNDPELTNDDLEIFANMMERVYHYVYRAILSSKLYSADGILHVKSVCLYNDDFALIMKPQGDVNADDTHRSR